MSQPAEIHALAGAYALNALTDIERAGFARHVAECPACAIEVAELIETASRLSAAAWENPPSRLRDAVLIDVARTRQVAAGTSDELRQQAQEFQEFQEARPAQSAQSEQARINAVLGAVDTRIVATSLGGGGRMIVAVSRTLDDGVVLMSDLPALATGKVYQLWLINGASPASIGVMPPGLGSGSALVTAIGGANTIGVTVEPAGGSVRPTSTPIGTVNLI